MKKSLRQSCFISIENNKNIGCQLFNIAYLINILNKSNEKNIKRKIVFRKSNNIYTNSLFKGLFTVLEDDKYDKINFEKMSINDINIEELSATYKNIEICDTDTSIIAKTFKHIDESIKNKILDLVYSNEDLMYAAYYKYRDIQDFFGNNVQDKDLVVLHILKDTKVDYDYYYNALSIMELAKIKNCAVITDDIEWAKTFLSDINDSYTHIFNYVNYTDENNNYEVNFILMSMFKNIIISDNKDDMDSIWASYISHYDIKKVITPDKNVIHKYITDIL